MDLLPNFFFADNIDNLHYVACSIRNQFAELGYSEEMIADMLVQYLYKNKKRAKQLFWFCYGEYIVENLKNNTKYKEPKVIQCIDCGEWIEVDKNNVKTCRCPKCNIEHNRELSILTFTNEDYHLLLEGRTFFELIKAKKLELQLASNYQNFIRDNMHESVEEINKSIQERLL